MRVLQVIVNGHRSMPLKEIAAAAKMPAAKVHRYLVSLIRSGMVEQDPLSSRYDLGPFAMTLGLVAADRQDTIRLGLSAIHALCEKIDEVAALIAWSQNGPIVVRWQRPRRPITISIDTGTTLNMLSTASGRIFGAFLPASMTDPLVQAALKASGIPKELRSLSSANALYSRVREAGLAVLEKNHLVTGVASMAAPVFNAEGEITLALAVIGFQDSLNTDPNGAPAMALRAAARELSQKLGHHWHQTLVSQEEQPKPRRSSASPKSSRAKRK